MSGVARKLYSLWLDPDLKEGLARLKSRDGINESDTIRAAVRAWIVKADAKAGRKRAVTRKRPSPPDLR